MAVTLREPEHRVSPRAVAYWTTTALAGAVVVWVASAVTLLAVPERTWWALTLGALAVVVPLVHVLVMPGLRYRVHRWEVEPTAIHTRSGWLTVEQRIAPLSRVQTVDSVQGPLMRLFRLATLTVTTASAAGPISIACLDEDVARHLVAELTEYAGQSPGDAT